MSLDLPNRLVYTIFTMKTAMLVNFVRIVLFILVAAILAQNDITFTSWEFWSIMISMGIVQFVSSIEDSLERLIDG